jgi:hypothetical protein
MTVSWCEASQGYAFWFFFWKKNNMAVSYYEASQARGRGVRNVMVVWFV